MNECCQHCCRGWVGGQPVSAQTIHNTASNYSASHGRPRRKPLRKMMHKKARKPFPEDKQTKDMNSWNQVLWSDENKTNLSGSDGVKHVWRQPGASKYLNVNEICSFNDITIKGEIYSQKSINYSANLTWTTRKETQTSLGK